MKILLTIIIIGATFGGLYYYAKINDQANLTNMTIAHTFVGPDGKILGYLYVKYKTDSLISDIYFTDDLLNPLIKMDRNEFFFLKENRHIQLAKNFYGYKISRIRDTEVFVGELFDEGKSVGDGSTIYWDFKTNTFKIFAPPPI